ncbi:hypothetical protein EV656_105173 [Rhodovulum adriaticum]|uniref:Uncharacterized protein n=1 Tax=Rhodovulum adriaticum TaxID=35804 RepID=A0A4R2NMR7_RHOAD|nr:hypothetical protein EV656_105173 [Rhodovulum adriaticum]
MNLHTAQSMMMHDRLDWNKPHLKWISNRLYRYFSAVKR